MSSLPSAPAAPPRLAKDVSKPPAYESLLPQPDAEVFSLGGVDPGSGKRVARTIHYVKQEMRGVERPPAASLPMGPGTTEQIPLPQQQPTLRHRTQQDPPPPRGRRQPARFTSTHGGGGGGGGDSGDTITPPPRPGMRVSGGDVLKTVLLVLLTLLAGRWLFFARPIEARLVKWSVTSDTRPCKAPQIVLSCRYHQHCVSSPITRRFTEWYRKHLPSRHKVASPTRLCCCNRLILPDPSPCAACGTGK